MIVAGAKFLALAVIVSALLPPGREMFGELVRNWSADQRPSVALAEAIAYPVRVSGKAAFAP